MYATQTVVTTATCIAEALSWELTAGEKGRLVGGLYAPYLGVAVFMGVDMVRRLEARVGRSMGEVGGTGKDREGRGAGSGRRGRGVKGE